MNLPSPAPLDLEALSALLARATPGPWHSEDEWIVADSIGGRGGETIIHARYRHDVPGAPNAAMICALVNAAPSLLAEVAAAREEIARLDKALREIDACEGRMSFQRDFDCDHEDKCRAAGICLSVERMGGTPVQKIARTALSASRGVK